MYFIGDIHGSMESFYTKINLFEIKNEILIQLGDFGIGFKGVESKLENLNKLLVTTNNFLYVCRGNHDCPYYFDEGVVCDYSNIKFVPDYTVLELQGKKVLFLGGSISIDRKIRTIGISWWPGEKVKFELIKLSDDIDIIVSHIAPLDFPPHGFNSLVLSYALKDPTLTQELIIERKNLQTILQKIKINNKEKKLFWFYGHYHTSLSGKVKRVNYRCLNCDEWYGLPLS